MKQVEEFKASGNIEALSILKLAGWENLTESIILAKPTTCLDHIYKSLSLDLPFSGKLGDLSYN